MKTKFARITTVLAFSSLLVAPALAAPTEYQLDSDHSFARFSYNHLGLSTQLSRFDDISGTIVFDPEAKTGEVDIVIDTTSVATGSEAFDGHIQGADFLATAEFPEARFVSKEVIFDGDVPSQIVGELTLKGITQPVTLDVTHFVSTPHPMMQKPAIGADAQTTILRSDFDMDKFAPHIADEVTVTVAIEALAP